ncbi:hypothetical protein [Clostridium cadaveris]|uniref:hypothetical protein n=1 Tax=Clostridium cadaveris TaxID=1529 RepID=UPI0039923D7B
MRTYKTKNESNKLFFTNYKRIDEEEVFNEIKTILYNNPLIMIEEKKVYPAEDIYPCKILDKDFELVYDIDYGGYIYSNSDEVISLLEKILNN